MGRWVTKALSNSGNLSSKKLSRKVLPFHLSHAPVVEILVISWQSTYLITTLKLFMFAEHIGDNPMHGLY